MPNPHSELMERLPIPDPTALTTQQLVREIASLKEIAFTRMDAMDRAFIVFNENINRVPTDTDKQISHLKELHGALIGALAQSTDSKRAIIETRIDGMDKAVTLLQGLSDKIPERTDDKIRALKDIQDEKFNSIQTQFAERDTRTDQTSKDSKVAVDAALQAAKEAVGEQNKSSALAIAKSEASTTKQIDQLGQLIQSGAKAVDDKFQDTKDRITRLEGKDEGKVVATATHQTSASFVVTIVSVVIAFCALAFAVVMAFRPH